MELQNMDVGVEFIQLLIPVNLLYVHSAFEDEVKQLAGEKYQTNSNSNCYRWGRQGGQYLGEQKVPVDVPRIRNKRGGFKVKLRIYDKLKKSHKLDNGAFKKVFSG